MLSVETKPKTYKALVFWIVSVSNDTHKHIFDTKKESLELAKKKDDPKLIIYVDWVPVNSFNIYGTGEVYIDHRKKPND